MFNIIANSLSQSELANIMTVSTMFNQKLELASNQEIKVQVEYLYSNFLEKMLFDSYNRKTYFNIMNAIINFNFFYFGKNYYIFIPIVYFF